MKCHKNGAKKRPVGATVVDCGRHLLRRPAPLPPHRATAAAPSLSLLPLLVHHGLRKVMVA